MDTHTHEQAHACKNAHMHMHKCALHTQYTKIQMDIHKHAHTCKNAHTHKCAHTHTDSHPNTHRHTQASMHRNTETQKHTHTHTHTHTHAHTQTETTIWLKSVLVVLSQCQVLMEQGSGGRSVSSITLPSGPSTNRPESGPATDLELGAQSNQI